MRILTDTEPVCTLRGGYNVKCVDLGDGFSRRLVHLLCFCYIVALSWGVVSLLSFWISLVFVVGLMSVRALFSKMFVTRTPFLQTLEIGEISSKAFNRPNLGCNDYIAIGE